MDWTLARHPSFPGVKGPVVVCIMDGVGIGRHDEWDAVWLARTPQLDALAAGPLSTALRAHGTAVGMPSDDDMGNSEVGHNALGCGRVFDQGAKLVEEAIESGRLFEGPAWRKLADRAREGSEPIHFIGLLSDGNVHSHIDHLLALLRRCHEEGIARARVHVLLDGRDVPERSALDYLETLEALLGELREQGRDYCIASGGGRMLVTMDRYGADWSIVERGWKAHVHGEARPFRSAREAVETLYGEDEAVNDQFLPAFVIADEQGPVGPIRDGASVVFFNFRGDRAMELSRAFEDDDFSEFDRSPRPNVEFAGMMEYDGDLHVPRQYLVSPPEIDCTLGEYLVHNDVTQLAISETQKFGHVTYFWNGNRSGYIDESRELYVEIPSDRLPFEERPWMKAVEITDRLVQELEAGKWRHARLNFANGDMVGHTGHLTASVIAVETVDLQLARLMRTIEKLEGALIVTADHGNCDEMVEIGKDGAPKRDEDGRPRVRTSHSLNQVPLYVHAPSARGLRLDEGLAAPGLANLAATVLMMMGYRAPADYAPSLLRA
ncbi:MAG: 2,3-bisphosphoglycerate-independent phosphoglycerate mutase [Myxococcota bacterium]|nr:2,3-bisphosphoglycerate-independent phosphoglycerate mutase [Myxococcota bacterium]